MGVSALMAAVAIKSRRSSRTVGALGQFINDSHEEPIVAEGDRRIQDFPQFAEGCTPHKLIDLPAAPLLVRMGSELRQLGVPCIRR